MREAQLVVGDIVRLEFDRDVAQLADRLDRWSPEDEAGVVATRVPSEPTLDRDFSAGALAIEFAIATASGVTSGVIASLLTARLLGTGSEADADTRVDVTVETLPVSSGATERVRLRVKAKSEHN